MRKPPSGRGDPKQHGQRAGALAAFALGEADRAAAAGEYAEALEWLARADKGSPAARGLEAEVRYRYGAELAAHGACAAAEALMSEIPAGQSVPASLVSERIRLLRVHRAATADLVALRSRFGEECPACRGTDLYAIASCVHQRMPLPHAVKLVPTMLAPELSGVYAAAAYRPGWDPDRGHPLTTLVRREKAHVEPASIRLLGAVLADYIAYYTPLVRLVDVLVPIPTGADREENRGGSIPYVFAATVRDRLSIPLRELLIQVAPHLDHTQASGTTRRDALRIAWRVRGAAALEGRTVLLVDDILTTGTTLRTAAEFLLSAGVSEVYGVTLMHTERSS
jgi:predicted amidophosphoribosyltransferase